MDFIMASCPNQWAKRGLENRKDSGALEQPPHADLLTPPSCFNHPICMAIPFFYG